MEKKYANIIHSNIVNILHSNNIYFNFYYDCNNTNDYIICLLLIYNI